MKTKVLPPRNLMIDCETMSTDPDAAIIMIGAVLFDSEFNILDTYSVRIDPCKAMGHVSKSTLAWWDNQDKEVRDCVMGGKEHTTKSALRDFSSWLESCGGGWAWYLGTSGDPVWLRSSYEACGLSIPEQLMFYNERCVRTLRELYMCPGAEYPKAVHNALEDAKAQVKILEECLYNRERWSNEYESR